VVDALTMKATCKAVGVKASALRVMLIDKRRDGLLPSSWYAPLVPVSEAAGFDLPLDAFKWKEPAKQDTAA
jgi:hypothetical protein